MRNFLLNNPYTKTIFVSRKSSARSRSMKRRERQLAQNRKSRVVMNEKKLKEQHKI